MTTAYFRLLEHVPQSGASSAPYIELPRASANDVWRAVARLDCWEYGGLMIWPADARWPRLDIFGCARLGYWVSFARSLRDVQTVMPHPDAVGSVDMVTGNQQVDVDVRKLCDSAAMNDAADAFLTSAR